MNNAKETKDKMCFDTIDGATLMSTPLQPLWFVVDSLISQELHVLAGFPKVGNPYRFALTKRRTYYIKANQEHCEKYSRTAEQSICIIYRNLGVMDSVESVEENRDEENIA